MRGLPEMRFCYDRTVESRVQTACLAEACDENVVYRTAGLCKSHWAARQRCQVDHTDCACWWDFVPLARRAKVCTHDNCSQPVRSSGLCDLHYNRSIKGRPMEYVERTCSECGTTIGKVNRTGLCQKCSLRAWNATPAAKARLVIRNNRARAKRAGAECCTYSVAEVLRLLAQPCAYCGTTEDVETDHVVPLSRGGRDAIGNLVPCCDPCNRYKFNRFITEWKARKDRRRRVTRRTAVQGAQ